MLFMSAIWFKTASLSSSDKSGYALPIILYNVEFAFLPSTEEPYLSTSTEKVPSSFCLTPEFSKLIPFTSLSPSAVGFKISSIASRSSSIVASEPMSKLSYNLSISAWEIPASPSRAARFSASTLETEPFPSTSANAVISSDCASLNFLSSSLNPVASISNKFWPMLLAKSSFFLSIALEKMLSTVVLFWAAANLVLPPIWESLSATLPAASLICSWPLVFLVRLPNFLISIIILPSYTYIHMCFYGIFTWFL